MVQGTFIMDASKASFHATGISLLKSAVAIQKIIEF